MKRTFAIVFIAAALLLSSCGTDRAEAALTPATQQPAAEATQELIAKQENEQLRPSLIMYEGQLYVLSDMVYDTFFYTDRGDYIGIISYETDRYGVPAGELGTNDALAANYELYTYYDGCICAAVNRENWIYKPYTAQESENEGFGSEAEILDACTAYAHKYLYEAAGDGGAVPALENVPEELIYLGSFEKNADYPPYTKCVMQFWYCKAPLTVIIFRETPSEDQLQTSSTLRNYDRVQMPLSPTVKLPFLPEWGWVKYQTHYESCTTQSNIIVDLYSSEIAAADYVQLLKTVKSAL